MDISKMGNRTWSEPGIQPLSSSAVSNFEDDIKEGKLTNSVGDLLQLTRQRTSRQFLSKSSTKSNLKKIKLEKKNVDTKTDPSALKSSQYQNVHERPPRRVEVSYLEMELKQMVKTVMNPVDDTDDDNVYQPHKEKVMLIRNRIFMELGIDKDKAMNEKWLENIVKSECLKDLCDNVCSKLTDMLSVSSAELGNVLRKLRYTYDQCFLQAISSWKDLQMKYSDVESSLQQANSKVNELYSKSQENDIDIREQIDAEVSNIRREFDEVHQNDKEKIQQLELQIDQMSGTLKNLNAIFKTMQSDVDAARSADTFARCSRLEREVADLEAQVSAAAKVKVELDEEKGKSSNMSIRIDRQQKEIEDLKAELNRRDITVAELMERETLRNAEIEKLTRMAAQRQENDDDLDLDPVASSVLCIKCKKSLDDISSIRDAILGKSSMQKLACQSYRILLPNNKGKKPHRNNSWLKASMRSILTTKMVETLSITPVGECVTAFPSFVYAWFEPVVNQAVDSHGMQSVYQKTDDDRWGLYYGVKTLAKEDAEAKLFWGLLDEEQGEDGLVFACHCLSVVLSIGGARLWKQFGRTMNNASAVANPDVLSDADGENTPMNIWLDLDTAFSAVKIILVRALESQVVETIDAIESLKVAPNLSCEGETMEDSEESKEMENKHPPDTKAVEKVDVFNNQTPTHIDLFVWLRVMMQRFQDEQCHRHAAVRLMFETASLGALTGPSGSTSGNIDHGENPHVQFPQFISVIRTLYPAMSVEEIAEIYAICYRDGETKVTASIFADVSDKKRLFSKSLKLGPLPLFSCEELDQNVPPKDRVFDPSQSHRTRSRIGSFVHSHYAIICEEVENAAKKMPHRWKALINDASESVRAALKDHFVKMKSKKRNFNGGPALTPAEGSTTKAMDKKASSGICDRYIDGIQPFIQYHRLLTLLMMVKSFSENTILPIGFLSSGGDSNSGAAYEGDLMCGLSFKRVENVLTSLEGAVLAHSPPAIQSRYTTFEASRRNIILRKIQEVFRGFLTHDTPIPRPVRILMRPGYLRGLTTNGQASLKSRRVYIEPWALQTLISHIYMFKINHDLKAGRSGQLSVELPTAVVAAVLKMFSVPDLSERIIQDVFLGMQTYMHGLPRVRMFACFLGCGEVEEPFASHLKGSLAIATYFELLMSIHLVVWRKCGLKSVTSIRELFPCSIDPSTRLDKRDLWELPLSTLTEATNLWSGGRKGFKKGMWENAMKRVRRSSAGLAEVDDFLWVMMQVWAKAIVSRVAKCEHKGKTYANQKGVVAKKKSDASIGRIDTSTNLLDNLFFQHFDSLQSLRNMINSIYESPNNSEDLEDKDNTTDMLQCSSVYALSMSKGRYSNYNLLEKMLTSCVLWDVTTPPKLFAVGKSPEIESDLNVVSDVRSRVIVTGAGSSVLSIRFAKHWWSANSAVISSHIDHIKCCVDEIVESDGIPDENKGLTLTQVAEMKMHLESMKKFTFRIEKILLEGNSPSNSRFGEDSYDIENTARSNEVWQLIPALNSSLSSCLETMGREFPRDAWKSGRKLHLDRASAYLMQVQQISS